MGLSITRQAVRIVALAAFALNATGCSTLFLDTAPDRGKWNASGIEHRQCDSESAWPVVDLLLAGISVAAVVVNVSSNDCSDPYGYCDPDSGKQAAVLHGLDALLFGISGLSGLGSLSECEAFKLHQGKRMDAAGKGLPSVPISNAD